MDTTANTTLMIYPDSEEGGWIVTDGNTGDTVSIDMLGRVIRFATRADAAAWVAQHTTGA